MQPSEIEIVDEISRIFLGEIGESISLRLEERISKENALVISIAPSPFRRPAVQDLILLWIILFVHNHHRKTVKTRSTSRFARMGIFPKRT